MAPILTCCFDERNEVTRREILMYSTRFCTNPGIILKDGILVRFSPLQPLAEMVGKKTDST